MALQAMLLGFLRLLYCEKQRGISKREIRLGPNGEIRGGAIIPGAARHRMEMIQQIRNSLRKVCGTQNANHHETIFNCWNCVGARSRSEQPLSLDWLLGHKMWLRGP